jgi:hypothetical protein
MTKTKNNIAPTLQEDGNGRAEKSFWTLDMPKRLKYSAKVQPLRCAVNVSGKSNDTHSILSSHRSLVRIVRSLFHL